MPEVTPPSNLEMLSRVLVPWYPRKAWYPLTAEEITAVHAGELKLDDPPGLVERLLTSAVSAGLLLLAGYAIYRLIRLATK